MTLRVLAAPCSFKGSLSARDAAAAMARGATTARPDAEIRRLPIADGGEGTLDALCAPACTSEVGARQHDLTPIRARLGRLDDDVIVETAEVLALHRVDADCRDVNTATTVGVADMVLAALDQRHERILVTLGGSGTVDGGLGFLRGLGAILHGVPDGERGAGALFSVTRVDLDPVRERLGKTSLVALCDVLSPLCGPRGARQYMEQKGADAARADEIERALGDWAEHLQAAGAPPGLKSLPGAGAAGGLGAALAALGASMVSGADFVLDAVGADAAISVADIVLTGEGRVDAQTGEGKALAGLARRCAAAARPCLALAGSVGMGAPSEGLTQVVQIAPETVPIPLRMKDAANLVEQTARRLIAAWPDLPPDR